MTTPLALSRQLRHGASPALRRRRAVAGLTLAGIGSLSLVTLYQLGVLRSLPEPPLAHFDADCVDASSEAYALLATPDGALGVASYAVTLVLAAMGGEGRAGQQPWIPLALAVKVTFDVLASAKLTLDQWTRHRAFCFWCLLAAVASFTTAPLIVPETIETLAQLRAKRAERAAAR